MEGKLCPFFLSWKVKYNEENCCKNFAVERLKKNGRR
jgi:hypothetical protein